ncbi:uncharacterized protein LOC119982961 [Tripterygium wilfordii]|uniref:uncharacterized protein LOC119982961 n=1 Tax=Tripterygium wilfordii TaxID=458696 RepID=UPI0018F8337F|nr:uncharacterized protein LOC119982961 [Tripterygium wilfordii]
MKSNIFTTIFLLPCFLFIVANSFSLDAQTCKPSGKIRGKKPPPKQCNRENDSDCCIKGKLYTTYKCSPPVSRRTKATLTLNSFEKGGDGGSASECDKKFHSDDRLVVALSTGWFKKKGRCLKYIFLYGNGRRIKALVVDECDSTMGCDRGHDYQPPCPNNVVDASRAASKALGVPEKDWGQLEIYWLDTCKPSGKIRGKNPPPKQCNRENDSDCCIEGELYTTYKCSPPVSRRTNATLTLNSFGNGGDGGGASECDNKFHSDDTLVVALSTGWFNNKGRCLKYIYIYGNGRRVKALVVDECDSTMGCDRDHDYQPPCPNNIVDASRAVWKALGVPEKDWGQLVIHWLDA